MARLLDNKELIQSYIITTAKYDFSAPEKRILYRVVELMQDQLEGKKLVGKIEPLLFGDYKVTIPITSLLKDKSDKNYLQVKKALKSLRNKTIEYEDDDKWKLIGIIEKPKHEKFESLISFELQPEIYEALLNFTKGYRKYELETAMSFNSAYSMRFYELVSNQNRPITYSISQLREMLCLNGKYKYFKDFRVNVLESSKKELDEKSPYTFSYRLNKTGRKYTSVTIIPIEQRTKKDPNIEKKELLKRESNRFYIPKDFELYLIEQFSFTQKGIKNNIELLGKAYSEIDDIYDLMTSKKRYILDASNPPGYLLKMLKSHLNESEE